MLRMTFGARKRVHQLLLRITVALSRRFGITTGDAYQRTNDGTEDMDFSTRL